MCDEVLPRFHVESLMFTTGELTCRTQQIELLDWMQEDTHPEAVDMMVEDAVVPFGTALWPV